MGSVTEEPISDPVLIKPLRYWPSPIKYTERAPIPFVARVPGLFW